MDLTGRTGGWPRRILIDVLIAGLVVVALSAIPATADVTSGERPVTITVNPERLLDTRADFGPIGVPVAGRLGPRSVLVLKVAGVGPVPADAVAAIVNVTALDSTVDSFITLYPADQTRPNSSALNPSPGQTVFNSAVVDLSAAGELAIYNHNGATEVLVDVTGYTVSHNHDDRTPTITVIESPPASTILNPGNGYTFVAECPAGYEPIAGGIDYFDERNIRVIDSFPTSVTVPGPSWVVRVYNGTISPSQLSGQSYATCVR